MLNGIDPIIIFHFSKLTKSARETVEKIPLFTALENKIGLPPIPIYLSEKITGLYIDSEDKSIEIQTKTEALAEGAKPPLIAQKTIGSTVRVTMKGTSDSIGLVLLSALCDLVVPKVVSQEYSITYLHGSTTVFNGLLNSFAISPSSENNLLMITLELAKVVDTPKEETPPPDDTLTPVSGPAIDFGSASPPPPPTAPLSKPIQPTPPPPANSVSPPRLG